MDSNVLDLNKRQIQLAHNHVNRIIKQPEHHPAKQVLNTIIPKHKYKSRYSITTLHQRYHSQLTVEQIRQHYEDYDKNAIRLNLRNEMKEDFISTDTASSLRNIIQHSYNTDVNISNYNIAKYLHYDDRHTASIRARLRLDRYYLPSIRKRIYNENIPTKCTYIQCAPNDVECDRVHVLTECHQFDNERQQCHNQLSQLDIINNHNTIPIHILLGEVDSIQPNK
jgi:hypothetical protein